MKNITCAVAIMAASLTLGSCEKESQTNYFDALIQGEWILDASEDDDVIASDKRFVLDFANGMQSYSSGYTYDDSREWKCSDKYSYQFVDDILTVEGTNADDVETYLKVKITSMNPRSMVYDVITLKYDGADVTQETATTQRFSKVEDDLDIIGLWEGVESGVEATRRFEFLADGTFKYYYKDGDEFVEKVDNDGKYLLYGDFLVCNYNNDMDDNTSGRVYECWDLELKGDNLTWRGVNNGVDGSLSMKRL